MDISEISPPPATCPPIRRPPRHRLVRLLSAVGAPLVTWAAVVPLSAQAPSGEEGPDTNEIIVMSTRAERPIADEPLGVEVVGHDKVEEQLVMTPSHLAMVLDATAGVRVQPTSPGFGGASVRTRGLQGRYTLILSDGLPLYGGQGGSLAVLQIPVMDLEQVEIISGPASALYGASALGGVVNLISRRPETEREVLLNGTSLGGTDAVLWLADDWGAGWGYTLLAAVQRQGQGDVDDDGWADAPGVRRVLVRPRLFWDDGQGRSVVATVGGLAEDREGGTMEGILDPSVTPFPVKIDSRYIDFGIVARAMTGGGRLLALRASTSLLDHGDMYGDTPEDDRHTNDSPKPASPARTAHTPGSGGPPFSATSIGQRTWTASTTPIPSPPSSCRTNGP